MTKEMKSKLKGTWVQTERKAHENWARLIKSSPTAAQLLHLLVANMDQRGTIVISQKTLAEMMGIHRNTVGKAIKTLTAENWVDSVSIGPKNGGVKCYCVNRRVAWADKRDNQKFAVFDAKVITSSEEQESEYFEKNKEKLKELPKIGELQIPSGDGEEPPSQQILPEVLPDIPALKSKEDDQVDIEELIEIKSKNK